MGDEVYGNGFFECRFLGRVWPVISLAPNPEQ